MCMQKRGMRGQAATEFLMTYGWTVLIIMIVVALLFALGVFDIKTPNTCYTPEPYRCLDVKHTISNNALTFLISASGIDASPPVPPGPPRNRVTAVKVNGVNCPLGVSDLTLAEDVPQQPTCNPSPALSKGNRFEGTISITYQKYGGNSHSVSGTFSGTAE